jgi:CubicO group peptidase (beta-lactamase class C family)
MNLSERVLNARMEGVIGGVAVALVRDAEPIQCFGGFADREQSLPVNEETLFAAASLSKPVFAYTVLKLVDQGLLSLDVPLAELVDYAPADAFAAQITAAHVLSHTTGFPNWRSSELPLRCYFRPGARFSYSGEGFVFLQRAVERLTGESIDSTVRRLVFEPLGMNRSTFRGIDGTCNAAHSLRTTAHDYARFLQAVLVGTGLKSATAKSWMEARTLVPANFVNIADPRSKHQTDAAVAWGLGWGLETQSHCFFQWGARDGYVSFTIGSRVESVAFVMLTTRFTGLECLRQLVEFAMPGQRPSLAWLGRRTDLHE